MDVLVKHEDLRSFAARLYYVRGALNLVRPGEYLCRMMRLLSLLKDVRTGVQLSFTVEIREDYRWMRSWVTIQNFAARSKR